MKCPQCNSETFVDHITQSGDTTTYFYACVNPKCSEYRKAYTPTGDTAEAQIQPPEGDNS